MGIYQKYLNPNWPPSKDNRKPIYYHENQVKVKNQTSVLPFLELYHWITKL